MNNINGLAKSFGLSLALFLVIYGLMFRLLNLSHESLWGWGFYLAIPVFTFLWYLNLRKELLTFKTTFKSGMRLVFFGIFPYGLFVYVYNKFIDDSLLVAVRESGLAAAKEQGLTAEALRVKIVQLNQLTSPEVFSMMIFLQLVVFGLLVLVVFGLISKYSIKNIENRPP